MVHGVRVHVPATRGVRRERGRPRGRKLDHDLVEAERVADPVADRLEDLVGLARPRRAAPRPPACPRACAGAGRRSRCPARSGSASAACREIATRASTPRPWGAGRAGSSTEITPISFPPGRAAARTGRPRRSRRPARSLAAIWHVALHAEAVPVELAAGHEVGAAALEAPSSNGTQVSRGGSAHQLRHPSPPHRGGGEHVVEGGPVDVHDDGPVAERRQCARPAKDVLEIPRRRTSAVRSNIVPRGRSWGVCLYASGASVTRGLSRGCHSRFNRREASAIRLISRVLLDNYRKVGSCSGALLFKTAGGTTPPPTRSRKTTMRSSRSTTSKIAPPQRPPGPPAVLDDPFLAHAVHIPPGDVASASRRRPGSPRWGFARRSRRAEPGRLAAAALAAAARALSPGGVTTRPGTARAPHGARGCVSPDPHRGRGGRRRHPPPGALGGRPRRAARGRTEAALLEQAPWSCAGGPNASTSSASDSEGAGSSDSFWASASRIRRVGARAAQAGLRVRPGAARYEPRRHREPAASVRRGAHAGRARVQSGARAPAPAAGPTQPRGRSKPLDQPARKGGAAPARCPARG